MYKQNNASKIPSSLHLYVHAEPATEHKLRTQYGWFFSRETCNNKSLLPIKTLTYTKHRLHNSLLGTHRSMLASDRILFLISMERSGHRMEWLLFRFGERGVSMHSNLYQSSSRVALWKHGTVHTRMKKDVNSMNMAPVSIRPACLRIAGIARLPMADAPVRNFAALIHLRLLPPVHHI